MKGDKMEKDNTYEWTKQQEVALNVFADFMASILEKYGPVIEIENNKTAKT